MSNAPTPTADDISKLSVSQLKQALKALNIDSSDCLEKTDLQSKLRWAQENGGHVGKDAPTKAGFGHGDHEHSRHARELPDFSVVPSMSFKRTSGGRATVKYDETPILMGNVTKPTSLLVIAHGFGDSADAWRLRALPLVWQLPHVLIYLASAPKQPVSIGGGNLMSAWFDIIEYPDPINPIKQRKEDIEGTLASARYVSHMAGHVAHKHKIPTNRIIFSGFSQGAAIAIAAGLTAPYIPRAVMPLSGFFAAASAVIEAAKSTSHLDTLVKEKVPFALFHGDSDQVLPVALARASLEKLRSIGINATLKEYRGLAHTVSEAEIKDVIAWLNEVTA